MYGLEELEPEENTGNDDNGNEESDLSSGYLVVDLYKRHGHYQRVKEALKYESKKPVRISNCVPII